MSENIKRLYHGTSFDVIWGKVLSGKEPLIGKRLLSNFAWSGTLTDDRNFAISWASRRGFDPIVLTYDLPVQIVVDEGLIGMKTSSRGFVTSLEVGITELPSSYIQALLHFNRLNIDVLGIMVKKGEMSFHAVPFEYLVSHEDA